MRRATCIRICGAIVDLLPWTRPLDWLKITEQDRCRLCDERVGDEIRRLIKLEAPAFGVGSKNPGRKSFQGP